MSTPSDETSDQVITDSFVFVRKVAAELQQSNEALSVSQGKSDTVRSTRLVS